MIDASAFRILLMVVTGWLDRRERVGGQTHWFCDYLGNGGPASFLG